jgi:hypothetical protein
LWFFVINHSLTLLVYGYLIICATFGLQKMYCDPVMVILCSMTVLSSVLFFVYLFTDYLENGLESNVIGHFSALFNLSLYFLLLSYSLIAAFFMRKALLFKYVIMGSNSPENAANIKWINRFFVFWAIFLALICMA